MYRNFRILTIENNRDGFLQYVQLFIDGDNLTPLLKQARTFAREKGIARIPPFESVNISPRRGIYYQALSKSNTGVIVSEVFP